MSVYKSETGRSIIQDAVRDFYNTWPAVHEKRIVETKVRGVLFGTHLIISGPEDAQPLLLLHGSSSNSSAWTADVGLWSRYFRVIAADIPGEPGLSGDFRLHPDGDDYSTWLKSLVDILDYESISIVGQSLGSFAALKLAVSDPSRVNKISMLTTSGIAPVRTGFIFKAIFLMLFGTRGSDRLNKLISYKVDTGADYSAFAELAARHFKPLTEPIPMFSDSELKMIKMPVQYFGGDHDVLLNTEATAARLRKFVPHAEINLLKETGHVVIGQTEQILRFIMK